jgi:hypothetical protein
MDCGSASMSRSLLLHLAVDIPDSITASNGTSFAKPYCHTPIEVFVPFIIPSHYLLHSYILKSSNTDYQPTHKRRVNLEQPSHLYTTDPCLPMSVPSLELSECLERLHPASTRTPR